MSDLTARIDRLESLAAIRELAARYAGCVNARDLDGFLDLFVDDIDCGRRGRGREAFRSFVDPTLRTFYRAVHQVGAHVIDVLDGDHAEGRVYGRCEQECDDQWIIQANVYFDTYARRDGRWYFVKRSEDFFYSCELLERPNDAGFPRWPGAVPRHHHSMMLERGPHWAAFWKDVPADQLERLTKHPGPLRTPTT